MKYESVFSGSWQSVEIESIEGKVTPSCLLHFVDSRTCVTEQRLESKLMVSWFQFWPAEGGFLRYPLARGPRSLCSRAEFVSIEPSEKGVLIRGYLFQRAIRHELPEPLDLYPGSKPNKEGERILCVFRGKLEEYLEAPP